jgi:hypothetical protein
VKPRPIHLVAGIVERGKKILLVEDEYMVAGHLSIPMFQAHDGQRPANVLRRGWKRLTGRNAVALESVATLRHSVLDRRYLVSLFTFEERPPAPSRSRQPEADDALDHDLVRPGPPKRISLLSPGRISRHAHGGLLVKVLAAWREHGR